MLVYVFLILSVVSMINGDTVFANCYRSNNAGVADFKNFVETGESNPKLNCAFRCIDDHYHMINADGTYDPDKTAASFPAILYSAAKKCAGVSQPSPPDSCQGAYELHKCMLDDSKEKYATLADNIDRILKNF